MNTLSNAFALGPELAMAAQQEAARWSHPAIDVDHLLLALLVIGGPAGKALQSCGVTLDGARTAVAALHTEHVSALGITDPEPSAGPIVDVAMGDLDWTARARAVLRGVHDWSSDEGVLRALLEDQSGLVHSVLAEVGTQEDDVRQALPNGRQTPEEAPPKTGWAQCVRSGFVPAPPHEVWALVSDPTRRPEWDPLCGRVERVDADMWDLWAATTSPDGARTRVPRSLRRASMRLRAEIAEEYVEWQLTQPDRADRSGEQRLELRLLETPGGTRVILGVRWRARAGWRSRVRRMTVPAQRRRVRQALDLQLAGIADRLREPG